MSIGEVVTVLLLANFVLVTAVFVARLVRYFRLHHPVKNRLFMRRYRTEHPQISRTTIEASPSSPSPPVVVRPRNPAGVDVAPTSASAGSTRERHAA